MTCFSLQYVGLMIALLFVDFGVIIAGCLQKDMVSCDPQLTRLVLYTKGSLPIISRFFTSMYNLFRTIQNQYRLHDGARAYLTSSPKGNDRSPDNKQVFLNSSQVSKRFFQLVKGS